MALPFNILKRSLCTSPNIAVKHVTVIGGGLMGSGIAQVAAQTGHIVTLVEVNEDLLKKAQASINTNLGRVAKKLFKDKPADGEQFISNTLARISGMTNPTEAVKETDLVVEAIVERIDLKHKLFSALDEAAPAKTIFASNTSSLPIAEIAACTKRKDRFGGLHFFNPVPMMKLLEVIRIPETSDQTYEIMMEWGKAMGKTCITCKDTAGFVVNRLLVPYIAEAVRMYERGDATARDIDIAMKLGAGYPMGPLELADYVGLDIHNSVLDGWHKKWPDNPQFKPNQIIQKLVDQGDASARDIDIAMKLGAGYPMGPLELADYVGLDTCNNILEGWQKKFPDNPLFNPPAVVKKLVSEGKCGIKSGQGFYSYKK